MSLVGSNVQYINKSLLVLWTQGLIACFCAHTKATNTSGSKCMFKRLRAVRSRVFAWHFWFAFFMFDLSGRTEKPWFACS